MKDAKDDVVVEPVRERAVEKPAEPPVVARLVVEIRSDGTRTIARGALQDASIGREVAIQAEGTTPLSLAVALVRSMLSTPILGRAISRALLRGRPAAKRPPGG